MHLAYAAEFFCGKAYLGNALPFFVALTKMKIFPGGISV